ncbi:MAG TPA: hypothetical protein VND96_14000 [Candidatus Micrarchaeaceae archaeon]|nr:hypothetical protein [Candidatus Micrarchaeaceae archaeon]
MRYVPEAERAAWHLKALEAAVGTDLRSQIGLLLKTKEVDRRLACLRNASDGELEAVSHYVMEPLTRKFAKGHPDQVARLCRALGMRILRAKKSRYYYVALRHLDEARRCYQRAGLGLRWEELVGEVRADHDRNSASCHPSRNWWRVAACGRSRPFSIVPRRDGRLRAHCDLATSLGRASERPRWCAAHEPGGVWPRPDRWHESGDAVVTPPAPEGGESGSGVRKVRQRCPHLLPIPVRTPSATKSPP